MYMNDTKTFFQRCLLGSCVIFAVAMMASTPPPELYQPLRRLPNVAISIKYKHPLAASILLHPVGVLFVVAIGINSFIRVKQGRIQWKSRTIDTTTLMKGISLEEEPKP